MRRRCRAREHEVFRVLALGVQVYRVESERDGKVVLRPLGPRADLFDYTGRKLGCHFMGAKGPVWMLGSFWVVGRELRKRSSPNADSIPELQLATTESEGGGVLGTATLVEQIDTFGGIAPPVVPALHAGDTLESPYSAEYVFYAAPS